MPTRIRLAIAGATGWVGRSLVYAVARGQAFELVGAVSRTHAGKALRDVLGEPAPQLEICGHIEKAIAARPDVLIDYTKPDAVKLHALTAIRNGVAVVIGTSGLTDEDYSEIDAAARTHGVGVIAGGNFSITAALLMKFATLAARHLPQWEILEYGTPGKPDAPNGTSRELAYKLSAVRPPAVSYPVEKTYGLIEARGAGLHGNRIHSVRLPGFVSSTEVIFGAPGETLRITQDTLNTAEPYVAGTLMAAEKVTSVTGLIRGLDQIIGL